MRTVKQVSNLTGISVRTLHYYDEIGLLKPSEITESGYRLYDDNALKILQQILFFKELDFSLQDIKRIMQNPKFDQTKAFATQRSLIMAKRDRLDGLIKLLDNLVEGDNYMSFKEFDMSEYFKVLDKFKKNHTAEIEKNWGNVDEFNKMTEMFKSKEEEIAKLAIKQYGSIEKYTLAMEKNLTNFNDSMDKLNVAKENYEVYKIKLDEISKKLTFDLNLDVSSKEITSIVEELITVSNEMNQGIDMGENYWSLMAEWYQTNPSIITQTDKKYGIGASDYIGKALKAYIE